MGGLASEEGVVLETELCFVLGQFVSPVLQPTTQLMAVICCLHFQSEALIPGAPRGTCITSTDRCGQRIMLSYLLIRIENAARRGRWCC